MTVYCTALANPALCAWELSIGLVSGKCTMLQRGMKLQMLASVMNSFTKNLKSQFLTGNSHKSTWPPLPLTAPSLYGRNWKQRWSTKNIVQPHGYPVVWYGGYYLICTALLEASLLG
eukprot:gb/GECG01012510.1/.p1 GENE.gb/GECG01012510.1/~~gb/GECG01012510.1/.p1  ORF type:complete len:117 (+),score=4.14 gb/GECG01012510.1/:1-351(+)